MSANALLKRFDIVADQPANIPALRRLVVDLAVRGKLLAADELDMDVEEMLVCISSKAEDLVSAGTIKKLKLIPTIGNDEVPAAYLARCTFARLGNIANLQKGLTGIQSSTPGEFPLVVTSAERGTCDHFDFDGAAAIIPLVSSTGHGNASINRLHYQEGKFALGTILCAVFPFDEQLISARFLYEYLTAFKAELLVSKMIGTANVTLTLGKIAEVPVPILAPAVQRRVDELMALCDQLEAAQQERERRRDRLAAASLQRLNQPVADTPPEIQREYARFHLHHLSRLATRPEHIKELRQTILNCAARGRLVGQNSLDEPASVLLERIAREKKLPFKVSKALGAKRGAVISANAQPFVLPSGWSWMSMEEAARPSELITYGILKPVWVASGVPTVRVTEMKTGVIDVANLPKCDPIRASKFGKTTLAAGDLLISKDGTIGKTAFVPEGLEGGNITQHVIRFPISNALNRQYVRICIDAPFCQAWLSGETKGVALQGVNVGDFRRLPLPIPPLAEQHRIVAKVDELMALCDQLEAQLSITQTDSRRLLEAVLEAALTDSSHSAMV